MIAATNYQGYRQHVEEAAAVTCSCSLATPAEAILHAANTWQAHLHALRTLASFGDRGHSHMAERLQQLMQQAHSTGRRARKRLRGLPHHVQKGMVDALLTTAAIEAVVLATQALGGHTSHSSAPQ